MNVKTMEGLAGAGTSVSMMSIPVNVAKEAERKGEVDKMQRALGYAAELTDQAENYSEKTSQGMKQEAKEAKEQEKLQQEKLIEARRAEREEQEKQAGEGTKNIPENGFDSVEISEEGRIAAEMAGQAASDGMEPVQNVSYDSSGQGMEAVQAMGMNLDVSA